jgi:hypothetical protein
VLSIGLVFAALLPVMVTATEYLKNIAQAAIKEALAYRIN